MGWMKLAVAGLLLAASACSARWRATSDTVTLAIVGADIVAMTEGASPVLRDQTILIADDRIVEVGPREDTPLPRGVETIDGRGLFVMPGLIDMHAHLEYGDDPDVLKLFVAHGVTTVRSMDGRPHVLQWRDQTAAGVLIGPRIVTAGPIIDGAPPLRDDNLSVADADSARAAVRSQAEAGYDFVKLYTNLSEEAFGAAVAEARALALPIAGHIPRELGPDDVLGAYWTIEHLSDLDEAVSRPNAQVPRWARLSLAAPLDQARAEAFAQRAAAVGVVIVPTSIERDRSAAATTMADAWATEPAMRDLPNDVVSYWRERAAQISERLDAEDLALLEAGRRNRLALIGILHRRGVRLAVGSDTPNLFIVPGASVHQELANFVEAGLTNEQALRAATAVPGQALQRWNRVGVVAPGASADLLLLRANPLDELAHLRARAGVVLAGRWIGETELAAMRDDFAH